MKRTVILGGGYAGVMAAARLASRDAAVTLIDAAPGLAERIRMHQAAAGEEVPLVPYERLFRSLPVEVIRARVQSIDRGRRVVVTSRGEIEYDDLVYALGSRSFAPEGAVSVEQPRVIHERMRTAKTVAVVGGGLTGIETASELAERYPGVQVTLIDRGALGARLSGRAASYLRAWMSAHGVVVREHTSVSDPRELNDDLVIWCGAFTVSPIGREAGLAVNERGQILVDQHLGSSDLHIYAIGDAAIFRDVRMGCATALPMGAYIADLLSGVTTEPFSYAFAIQCISLGRNDGIIQFVHPDDTPRERVLLGRPAAWVKELVCRYTVLSLRLETRGLHYWWPKEKLAA
jgi:NADH dehydrogenase